MNPSEILRTIMGRGGGSRYPEISQFLKSPARNAWIDTGDYHAYLRKTPEQLDLANFERRGAEDNVRDLPVGERPSRGDLQGFMDALEQAARDHGIDQVHVESIVNEFLPKWLEARGYETTEQSRMFSPRMPSMTKRVR